MANTDKSGAFIGFSALFWSGGPLRTRIRLHLQYLEDPTGENVVYRSPSVSGSLHPLTFQQFLACSSPVFVEPSQWEVGSRHILYSPADWREHFICSRTDFGLVWQTHISVYFCRTRLRTGVFLCQHKPWPVRCYKYKMLSKFFPYRWCLLNVHQPSFEPSVLRHVGLTRSL